MSSKKTYIIYCHTNKLNGKRYVGRSVNTLEGRWYTHVSGARNNSQCLFHKAIRKYGFSDDAWKHELLEVISLSVVGEKLRNLEILFGSLKNEKNICVRYEHSA